MWCGDGQVPSSFIFLGIRNESAGSVHGLHTPRFTMDEGVMPLGAALHASMAFRGLRRAAAAAEDATSHTELEKRNEQDQSSKAQL